MSTGIKLSTDLRGGIPTDALREFRRQLLGRSNDLRKQELSEISLSIGDSITNRLNKTIPDSLTRAGKSAAALMFSMSPDDRDTAFVYKDQSPFNPVFRTLKVQDAGGRAQFDLGAQESWRALAVSTVKRKRKRRGNTFFVYRGNLRKITQRKLPEGFAKFKPAVSVTVRQDGEDRQTITLSADKSLIFDTLGAYGSDRELQDILARKMGFSVTSRRKLAGKTSETFRPTIIVAARHWSSFTLPRLLRNAILSANAGPRRTR